MKKTILIISVLALALGYVLLSGFFAGSSVHREAQGVSFALPVDRAVSHPATSTNGYIGANNAFWLGSGTNRIATATMEANIENHETGLLGLFMVASTVYSGITVEAQLSSDGSAWYQLADTPLLDALSGTSTDPQYDVATKTLVSFFPMQYATSQVAIPIDLHKYAAKKMRFLLGGSGVNGVVGNSSLWAEFIMR